jgi:hypothetical protein
MALLLIKDGTVDGFTLRAIREGLSPHPEEGIWRESAQPKRNAYKIGGMQKQRVRG